MVKGSSVAAPQQQVMVVPNKAESVSSQEDFESTKQQEPILKPTSPHIAAEEENKANSCNSSANNSVAGGNSTTKANKSKGGSTKKPTVMKVYEPKSQASVSTDESQNEDADD
jgi:hypothetical protein